MDREVSRHTETLAQKTRSLQVLYDVAASVNLFNDLDDLLTRFLHTLIDVVKAQAATVRLLDKDGQMRLVASVGLSDQRPARELAAPPAPSGWTAVTAPEQMGEPTTVAADTPPPLAVEGLHTISVPLRYHGKTLGVYDLFVDRAELVERGDLRDLLTSIGRHLGMAVEKVRVDVQAQRLSIMQERNLLAHELHDSLAQTLASLRFQVRMLDDTIEQGDPEQARRELERIRNSLEEANAELRGLLAHFRAPIDRRGLLAALEELVGRFRRETGIVTFFQKECAYTDLPATQEMQVLRIVQECLANIRKHSQAHAVRILLRCDDEGHYHVMVEDDGVGFGEDVGAAEAGDHIGLAILQERARRLGGELNVESEPAEGTRVELNFSSARAR
jgi:two-component system nitrate/nitrite sensor histidine kinase NarX